MKRNGGGYGKVCCADGCGRTIGSVADWKMELMKNQIFFAVLA